MIGYHWHEVEKEEVSPILVWERQKGRTSGYARLSLTLIEFSYIGDVLRSRTLFREPPETVVNNVTGFVVKDNHIFIARRDETSALRLLSSEDQGDSFHRVRFPRGIKTRVRFATSFSNAQRFQIIDAADGSAFINVELETPAAAGYPNWGNVYTSGALDTDFSLSLSYNAICTYSPLLPDFSAYLSGAELGRMQGMEGIYVANRYTDITEDKVVGNYKETVITYDKGSLWYPLPIPANHKCNSDDPADCHLNIAFNSWYTRDQAVGFMIGSGNVGRYLASTPREMKTYFSRDAGRTWTAVEGSTGSFAYEFGNRGAIILTAEITEFANQVTYSLDEGKSWIDCVIPTVFYSL